MSVDVLLVTYNHEKYIIHAVESILMQRINPDVECRIVVADDVSSDKTVSLIRALLKNCKWEVTFLPSTTNVGHCLNYKRAFKACSADYVAILEGDDYWCNPYHLQKHLDFLDEHRECVLSSNDPFMLYEDQHRIELWDDTQLIPGVRYYGTSEVIYCNKINGLSTCVIRRDALMHLPQEVFNTTILDWPMYICLSEEGLLCVHNEGTSVYRIQSSGIWSGSCENEKRALELKMLEEAEAILKRHEDDFARAKRFILGTIQKLSAKQKLKRCFKMLFNR